MPKDKTWRSQAEFCCSSSCVSTLKINPRNCTLSGFERRPIIIQIDLSFKVALYLTMNIYSANFKSVLRNYIGKSCLHSFWGRQKFSLKDANLAKYIRIGLSKEQRVCFFLKKYRWEMLLCVYFRFFSRISASE